jgi:plasmid stabilization system protein ParE
LIKNRYVLTPGAVDDIREIGDWSLERWGRGQTVQYLTELHQGLEYVAENFKTIESKKNHDELSGNSGLLLYPINKHYVVFTPVGNNVIAVAAVIRQGRDIPSILQKGGFEIRRELHEIEEGVTQGRIVPPNNRSTKKK